MTGSSFLSTHCIENARPASRVAAIVFPELACELVRAEGASSDDVPWAIVLAEATSEAVQGVPIPRGSTEGGRSTEGGGSIGFEAGAAIVFAANPSARARGVASGMRVAEATSRVAGLAIARLAPSAIARAIEGLAEIALHFGPTVELVAPDALLVDVTGAAHLFGGERALVDAIVEQFGELGHASRVALADGPTIALAMARVREVRGTIVPTGEGRAALHRLPIAALPIDGDALVFFGRLGVLTVGDLARIDRAQLASRLEGLLDRGPRPSVWGRGGGPSAREVLAWLDGDDARPLVPHRPAERLVETIELDDGVGAAGPLLFALRGAIARLCARLAGRRQACNCVEVVLHYDRTILRLRERAAESGVDANGFVVMGSIVAGRAESPRDAGEVASLERQSPELRLVVELPAPLGHTDDVFRAVKAKLEATRFDAPVVRLAIELSRITRAPEIQLDLSRSRAVSPDALPALVSELAAELGSDRVGLLAPLDDHRPERRSRLVGVHEGEALRCGEALASPRSTASRAGGRADRARKARRGPQQQLALFAPIRPDEPPRLLPEPVPLGHRVSGEGRLPRLVVGSTLFVGRCVFEVVALRFDRRLDGVAWWSSGSASRDYLRALLALVPPGSGPRTPRARGFFEPGAPHPAENDTEAPASRRRARLVAFDREPENDGSAEHGPIAPRASRSIEPALADDRRPSLTEAWIFADRITGEAYLQGYWE